MGSIASGSSATVALKQGDNLRIQAVGDGYANVSQLQGIVYMSIGTVRNNAAEFGPFSVDVSILVEAVGASVMYDTADDANPKNVVAGQFNPLTGVVEIIDPATGLPLAVGGGGGAELPYDTVSLTTTTAAIRSGPCQIAGLSCSASTSLNVTIYANSTNTGTVIWSGALTAGQVVALPAPYSSFIGLSAQIVSGSGTFVLYVK